MKFTTTRREIQKVLSVADRIVPKKGGMPAHYAAYVFAEEPRVEGSPGTVEIRVTNGDVIYATVIEAAVETAGSHAIPAAQLIAAAAAAPDEEIVVEATDSATVVTSGSARWDLDDLVGVATDFAPFGWPDDAEVLGAVVLSIEGFVAAVETVRYAAATSANRPSLMQIHAGEGRVIAGDGRRLHSVAMAALADLKEPFDLPSSLVETLMDAIRADAEANGEDQLSVTVFGGFMGFAFGASTLIAGSLAYEFPPLDEMTIVPAQAQGNAVTVAVADLLAALRVARVSDDVVQVRVTSDAGIRVMSASQRGQSEMSINARANTGWVGHVRADLVEEMLGKVGTEEITLRVPVQTEAGSLLWITDTEIALVSTIRT